MGEMTKKRPQLAALSDYASSQPKLSLLLNCMGVEEAAISATRDLDYVSFKRLTKRHECFVDQYATILSVMAIKDLLYCGEMLRDSEFPFSDHDLACAVCANHTATQMINFVKERGDIDLPLDVIAKKNINGKRALFCTPNDFPSLSKQHVRDVVDRLNLIHEEAM